jgi:hypothetical protein
MTHRSPKSVNGAKDLLFAGLLAMPAWRAREDKGRRLALGVAVSTTP